MHKLGSQDGSYIYQIFCTEVLEQLKADQELAFIFYSHYQPCDMDIEPLHNRDWIKFTAIPREVACLNNTKHALKMSKEWITRQ